LVVDAGVVGIKDEEWGARPIAAIVWDGDPAQVASELRAFLRPRLAGYKVPDRFFVLESLPRSTSGKLLRRELQQLVARQPPEV
jgi:acyl-CoA synthetase (AMP-forming)/AMP-acid ligase II